MKQKVKFFQIATGLVGIGEVKNHTLYGLDNEGRIWGRRDSELAKWICIDSPEIEQPNTILPPETL